jgi:hypothetical protein
MPCADYLTCFRDEDDGVPPCCACTSFCPLHHKNILNNCCLSDLFGTIGFPFFDTYRKLLFGISTIGVVISILITTYGCFGLSPLQDIVGRTFWAGGLVHNTTSGDEFTLYMGLSSVIRIDCGFHPGYTVSQYSSNCHAQTINWSTISCKQSIVSAACDTCSVALTNFYLTTIGGCVFLIISYITAQTRMRIAADVAMQKFIGVVFDGLGTLSLVFALVVFQSECVQPLKDSYNEGKIYNQIYTTLHVQNFCIYVHHALKIGNMLLLVSNLYCIQ